MTSRTALREERAAIWARASAHPAAADPGTAAWLERARGTGAAARLVYADHGEALLRCLDAAAELPARPPEAIAVLAARLLGSAHGFDGDQPAGQLLVALLAAWRRRPAPTGAAGRRELLAAFGVLSDPISCAVTALNLPVAGDRLIAGMTRLAAGRHLSLTLGNLISEPLSLRAADVFICENPTVLAEAERRLGAAAPALVCADGQFNTACLRLLEALAAAGCRLHVHADFDWGGLSIVSRAIQTAGARPWRYGPEDYHEALAQVPTAELSRRPAPQVDARLAPLAAVLGARGRAIHEEALIEPLLRDLAEPGRAVGPSAPAPSLAGVSLEGYST
ncbi:MAG: TIGR02679 family protein [Actinobacteria bacterium]|nr:TIGR02679 family protein [Actinomycetota bacterium]